MEHIFERAGLGKAPFKFVSIDEKWHVTQNGEYIEKKPGASCQYCYHPIAQRCHVVDSEGKRFFVGNECIKRTGDSGLINPAKLARRQATTEARHEREKELIDQTAIDLTKPEIIAKLISLPHPRFTDSNAYHWATWMMTNAGNKGKLDVGKYLQRRVTSADSE